MKLFFVLGAGASHDFGYPIGDELKSYILSHLGKSHGTGKGTTGYYGNLASAGNSEATLAELVDFLAHSERQTIDEFIRAHYRRPQLQRLARQAIALAIAQCEDKSKLFDKGFHWYKRLLDFLRLNGQLLDPAKLFFATFNYDRSLEYYLHKALHAGGGDFEEEQINAFFKNNFLHIHGSVGQLPWQATGPEAIVRGYADSLSPDQLRRMADNIITPDQEVSTSSMRERLIGSDLVVILGFGFAEWNKQRIFFDELISNKTRILASTNGRSDVEDSLKEYDSVTVSKSDCNDTVARFVRDFQAKRLP